MSYWTSFCGLRGLNLVFFFKFLFIDLVLINIPFVHSTFWLPLLESGTYELIDVHLTWVDRFHDFKGFQFHLLPICCVELLFSSWTSFEFLLSSYTPRLSSCPELQKNLLTSFLSAHPMSPLFEVLNPPFHPSASTLLHPIQLIQQLHKIK